MTIVNERPGLEASNRNFQADSRLQLLGISMVCPVSDRILLDIIMRKVVPKF